MKIAFVGCDATTLIETEVNEAELAFLRRIQSLAEAKHERDCYPCIRIGDEIPQYMLDEYGTTK